VEDIAKKFGAIVTRTPVGEINVAKKMKEIGAVVGGEGSGGVILPDVHLGRDALVGIGLTLQHLAEFDGPISELKKSLPQYVITKKKTDIGSASTTDVFNRIQDKLAGRGRVNRNDGLKVDLTSGWVHLRKSNTEPIIRIIAEAPTLSEAEALASEILGIIQH
jgi:phosphomannomutase